MALSSSVPSMATSVTGNKPAGFLSLQQRYAILKKLGYEGPPVEKSMAEYQNSLTGSKELVAKLGKKAQEMRSLNAGGVVSQGFHSGSYVGHLHSGSFYKDGRSMSADEFYGAPADGSAAELEAIMKVMATVKSNLNEDGTLYARIRTPSFFDPIEDPVTETPVRHDGIWHFVSFKGLVHRVDLRHKKAKFLKPWSLFTPQENDQNWRVGGQQHIAISDHYGKLYSIHHKGSGDMPNSAKDPGDEVWVYDINKKKRVQKIALKRIANEIQVTRDKHPLLFAAFVAIPEIDVYDAISGEFLRTITEIGMTPTGLLVQ